jgi:hypothetical protein
VGLGTELDEDGEGEGEGVLVGDVLWEAGCEAGWLCCPCAGPTSVGDWTKW